MTGLPLASPVHAQNLEAPANVQAMGSSTLPQRIDLSWDAPQGSDVVLAETQHGWTTIDKDVDSWQAFHTGPTEDPGDASRVKGTTNMLASRFIGRVQDIGVRHCDDSGSCSDPTTLRAVFTPNELSNVAVANVKLGVELSWSMGSEYRSHHETWYEFGYSTETSDTTPSEGSLSEVPIASNRGKRSHTFTGLEDETEYKFFVRTFIRMGETGTRHFESDWIAKTITTDIETSAAPEITKINPSWK